MIRYQGKNCDIPDERVNFFNCILYSCLRDKVTYDKIPHEEDYIDFITFFTQGSTSKIKMILCKIHKICQKSNFLHG